VVTALLQLPSTVVTVLPLTSTTTLTWSLPLPTRSPNRQPMTSPGWMPARSLPARQVP
jgi:hypothetical protein